MNERTCPEMAHVRSEGGYRFWQMYTCGRPVKVEARVNPFSPNPEWRPVCGIHARRYAETRALRSESPDTEPDPREAPG